MPLAGGDACEITRHMQSISDIAWAPDGAHIAYITDFDPDNPDEEKPGEDDAPRVRVTSRLDYKVDGLGYRNDIRKQVFIVGVETGERRKLTSDAQDYAHPRWSPDGLTIAAQRSGADSIGSRLALLDVATGATTLVGPQGGIMDTYAWSPDGKQIIYSGEDKQTYHGDIWLYDVESGERTELLKDLDWNPGTRFGGGMIAEPAWLDEQHVFFPGARGGSTVLRIVDTAAGSAELVRAGQNMPGAISVAANRSIAARTLNSLDRRGEIAVINLADFSASLITSYSDEVLETHPQALWERFDIEREGLTIEAWMLKPPSFDPGKKYPVILDIHGGPNGFYGYDFSVMHQALASAGYIVVYSNPRGSGSYSHDFSSRVFSDWGGEDFKDLMAVMDAALERPYCDAGRQGVRGYSYGGYMTSWIIGQTERFRACVCGAPCFDLESFWGTSDIGVRFGTIQFGGPAHELPEWYAQHSPSYYAHRVTTPTLIIHGEADERCPIGQGEQMFIALKKAGVDVEFARYPGGAHPFPNSGPIEHRVDVLERTLTWFDRYLKDGA
jgi:dipeptidyl aminopeptidase/acylaminoacyl peptidase